MSVSGSRAGAAGEAENSLRLYGESTARARCPGRSTFACQAASGAREADGDTAASASPVLSLNVSRRAVEQAGAGSPGLSDAEPSLLKLDAEGRAEVGASAEVSGTAAIDKRNDGLGDAPGGQAEAFPGLKAEER